MHTKDQQPFFCHGHRGEVGILDIDLCRRECAGDAGESARTVVVLDHQNLILDDQGPVGLKDGDSAAGVAHDHSDDGMIDRVGNGQSIDIDLFHREGVADLDQCAGLVCNEDGELFDDSDGFHNVTIMARGPTPVDANPISQVGTKPAMIRPAVAFMEILIVGAGIGGMTLAALLKQRGIGCTVIDRSTDLSRTGHALSLYPMGSRVLHGLGVFEEFEKRSAPFRLYDVHNGSGDLLHRFDMSPVSREFGYTGQILRNELIDVLRGAAPDVPLQMGLGLEYLDQQAGEVRVRFSDGAIRAFDAVIGADGIHSKTRRIIFGDEPDDETGWGLWAWWTAGDLPRDTVQEFWGRGRFLGIYPTPTLVGAVAAGPRALLAPEIVESNGLIVREVFSAMGGTAADVIAGFPARTDGLAYWNFHDYRSRRWVQQRVALLGDSACSFLPTAGVGASMAMESAAVMADELSRTNSALLPQSLALYEKRRRHRVESAQDDARKLAAWMATESVPLVWTRDHFMKTASAETLVGSIAASMRDPI